MGKFLEQEKLSQIAFKQQSQTISEPAREDGYYKTRFRSYCLPRTLSIQNLLPDIREVITEYFDRNEIKWHDAIDQRPSNHLCDSQVSYANFLFPFANHPETLAELFRKVFPTLKNMIPVEDGLYIAFEWIGRENFLGEKISRNRKRTRGANFTSADAAVLFQHFNGSRQFVLIEWKYTESYSPTFIKFARSGTDRSKIYAHLFDAEDCPFEKALLPNFDVLFYEPFYQFMRQQFLANEMEKAREMGANVVSLLHISPSANLDFKRITSPELKNLGISATNVWKNIVKHPDRFLTVAAEDFFGDFPQEKHPEMHHWFHYISTRYPWISEKQK